MYRHKVAVSWLIAAFVVIGGAMAWVLVLPNAACAQAAASEAKPAAVAKAAPQEGGVEEITVTGTRIGRTNIEEYAPIAVVSSEQIQESGVTTIKQLLDELPQVSLQGLSKNDNNGGNGAQWVDLRNLGPNRTLVLVDGKRFVGSMISGASYAVDLSNIPVSMIERVEVLLDGASAVYGSDAIGGVVNIILKHDFEGLQLDAFGGVSTHGDGEQGQLSGTWGAKSDRGRVVVNGSVYDEGAVKQKDRDWSHYPVTSASFKKDPDTGKITGIKKTIGSSILPEGLSLDTGEFFRPDPSTGLSYQDFLSTQNQRFNYGDYQWLTGEVKRYSLTLLGDYDVTKDLTAYLQGSFTERTNRYALAPTPVAGGTDSYGPGKNGMVIPLTNPYIPADFKANLVDPDPTITELTMLRRVMEVGQRFYDTDSTTFRTVGGFKGKVLENIDWDLWVDYGRNDTTTNTLNSLNLTKLEQTLDPAVCAANAANGCVVGNYFGLNSLYSTPGALKYIRYTDTELLGLREFDSGLTLSGHAFQLPGGKLGFAGGVEYRDESGFDTPSPIVQAGDSVNNALDATAGSYNLYELFGELSIPILSGMPGAHDLTVDLAGRFSDYNTFGSKGTYRAGVSYAPVKDVRLRGIVSTSFRAPGIDQLYGGRSDSYNDVEDPCNNWDTRADIDPRVKANCQAAGIPAGYDQQVVSGGTQMRVTQGGNPKLRPETATLYNAGMVFTPSFLEGFSLTTDYYNIQIENAIALPDNQYMIDTCYGSAGMSSPFCSAISRASSGAVNNFLANLQNIGKTDTQGVDIAIDYLFNLDRLGLNDIGKVDVGWQANYLLEYSDLLFGQKVDYTGTISANLGVGTYGNLRFYAPITFSRDNWSVTNTIRYIPAAAVFSRDPKTDPYSEVGSTTYWDLAGQLTLDRWTFTAGITNLLDTDPPFLIGNGVNAATEGYDLVGRFFFGSVSVKL